jgi:nucleotide-binding universal stress UspA family protein
MGYKSMMVNLQPGQTNGAVLAVAADLAERFGAHVLGVALCRPLEVTDTETYLMSDLAVRDRETRQLQLVAAEQEFHKVMLGRATSLDWHGSMTTQDLTGAITDHARSADLVVAGAGRDRSCFDPALRPTAGDLVMQTGRPVFVVPETVKRLSLDHILVGWKDGREARRAVADALPLLAKARRVTVVEISPADRLADARSHLNELVTWLGRHGIAAEALPLAETTDAPRLDLIAADLKADLIVAGAYAHNRLQEWVMGGVTRNLLLHADLCSMVSH